jgi:hypothetical protein
VAADDGGAATAATEDAGRTTDANNGATTLNGAVNQLSQTSSGILGRVGSGSGLDSVRTHLESLIPSAPASTSAILDFGTVTFFTTPYHLTLDLTPMVPIRPWLVAIETCMWMIAIIHAARASL